MSIVNPSDTVERQNEKLLQITEALMHRVEASSADAPEFLDLEFSDLGIQRPAQANRITARPTRLSDRGTHPAPDRNVGGLHRALKRTQDLQSQLMQAQEAADLLRRDLGDITEAMTEGFALFDARDCLVICNSRFCRDFRDTVTDLQPGVSLQACVTQISQSQHLRLVDTDSPQNRARRWMHQHLDASAPFNVALSDDRWLQVSAHRTADGGTTVVHADITDAVRRARDAGSRQRDKQTRLIRATLDSLNQGVGIFDEHDQLLAWNAKLGAVLGIPAHRLYVGAVFEALLDDLTAEMRFADLRDRSDLFRWARTPSGRRPISFDVERDGGIHLQIFASALPARDPSDREVRAQDTQRGSGIVLSCTDVSAERDIAHTLSELNAQLEHRVLER
ncbi:MAG: PAS-domain containing protein, partial [Paracoccaceae bacterium]